MLYNDSEVWLPVVGYEGLYQVSKLGNVTDKKQRNLINKVCFNTFFFGEKIDWEEVLV